MGRKKNHMFDVRARSKKSNEQLQLGKITDRRDKQPKWQIQLWAYQIRTQMTPFMPRICMNSLRFRDFSKNISNQ
ncbi:hypothetical protein FGO68_gene13035 [Halteria grandinella]|uniref:Uncharacterized protein n=1 Tax=Halteria grandinella TaxID=5974 RepID=A0A8J8P0R0_HALGN|nr:hypothetical protein FGO68_gene13035 [Halteria grandinella]